MTSVESKCHSLSIDQLNTNQAVKSDLMIRLQHGADSDIQQICMGVARVLSIQHQQNSSSHALVLCVTLGDLHHDVSVCYTTLYP